MQRITFSEIIENIDIECAESICWNNLKIADEFFSLKYFISASTDSVHRKELAKQGLAIIDNYHLNQKGAIFASTKNLYKLEENLKTLE